LGGLEWVLTIKENKMSKPIYTISKDVKVGIYDSEYVARVYKDKVIVTTPYVRWRNNTGTYAESKDSIRNFVVIADLLRELGDDCEDRAWELIGHALGDEYLKCSCF